MQGQGFVELEHEWSWQGTGGSSYPRHRDRSDLLGLCLGVLGEARLVGGEKHLERIHPCDIGGDGHNGDHPSPQSGRGRVGAVVGHDDRRPLTGRLSFETGPEYWSWRTLTGNVSGST